ncbi:alpha/beta-hydrolase family protein [Pseudonocardia asaccharolytica]|uniref:Alpha/beta-hydrolase catalytic domain-containing protein n=1 Tax=Pseudonocardia asaccharolytica DSM 44247 = NBRC 16224 TaxID=1123024 RepID=A0A511CWM6_9PSEU|nr:alpha/beta-hydrolase family protein [Pseudonocardia asaccharolytica]GEL16961.1 hypothetical protein PA7_07980 [Pseudonocardia asaccharolytica DSM 44247 = NBRC 16224]
MRDAGAARENAAAVVAAVRARLDAIAAADRPRPLMYGESLGAIAARSAADGADGVLVAGTPAAGWEPVPDRFTAVRHADDPVVWFSPRLLVERPEGWPGPWLPSSRSDRPRAACSPRSTPHRVTAIATGRN